MVLQYYLPIRCLLATAVLASLLVGPVARAESPQLLPTRDVDITYDVTLPSQPRVRERVRWLAAEKLERVDGPHKSTTIFNRRTREIIHLSLADLRSCRMPSTRLRPSSSPLISAPTRVVAFMPVWSNVVRSRVSALCYGMPNYLDKTLLRPSPMGVPPSGR